MPLAELPEVPKFMSSDLKTPALNRDYKMIDNKRSLVKKETKSRSDALYTVTSNRYIINHIITTIITIKVIITGLLSLFLVVTL